MRNFLFRVWIWLKVRFQQPLSEYAFQKNRTRSERRYAARYYGIRIYTKAPAIL